MIYLDHAAKTRPDPRVLARFAETEGRVFANPLSKHPLGAAAAGTIEAAEEVIGGFFGGAASFLSSAGEANLTAVSGLRKGGTVLTSRFEHPSINAAVSGLTVETVGSKPDGTLDLEHLREMLGGGVSLLAVSVCDAELGAVQPIAGIAEILRGYPDCAFLTDASQAAGKIPVTLLSDALTFAPHKLGGLAGAGVLVSKRGLPPLYRRGTPPAALIDAAAYALALAESEREARFSRVSELNAALRERLKSLPRVRINSPASAIPHILNLSVEGLKGFMTRDALAERGVCVSVKSACAADLTPSRAVLAAFGERKRALEAFRVSLSHGTEFEEIEIFCDKLEDICEKT